MTSPITPDETRLKSLIRSVLLEDGVIKRDDSEQTIENSIQPATPSPSVDPFTTQWYMALIPHKVREPFQVPDTLPRFFNIGDAQHAALFNPNTAAGGCREADVLYQAIAFLHRILDDILPLIDGLQLVDIWKSIKGVSEMLHTRYDLLCALRRSRDDQHVRCLEMFMQPPSGDGAASARIHREICRAVSQKRPREDLKDVDAPRQTRQKTSPSVDVIEIQNDEVAVVAPTKHEKPPTLKTPTTKDTKETKMKSRSPKKIPSSSRGPRSKTMGDTPKSKRSSLVKTESSPIVFRTRSSDVTKRLRSSSTSRIKSEAGTANEGKPASATKIKETSSAKKPAPKRQLSTSKKPTPAKKKMEPKKNSSPSKLVTAEKNSTPKKLRASSEGQLSTASASKKVTANKKVAPSKKGAAAQKDGQSNPSTPLRKVSSVKKSDSQSKIESKNRARTDGAEKDANTETKAGVMRQADDEKVAPDPQVDDTSVPNMHADTEVEVVHGKLSKKELPNSEKKVTSTRNANIGMTSGDTVEQSSDRVMTHFTFVARGSSAEQINSPLHTLAGYQWRLVVYPRGDNQKDWMSVYLECRGPEPSQTDKINWKSFASETTETTKNGGLKSDQAWFVQAKFSVRVLRTDSMVTKAALEGKDVSVGNDHALLSTSKFDPDRKIVEAGLLSDFVGEMSHGFSPVAERAGFSRLAPTSCLDPGMYADDDKSITLILLMCVE